MKRAIALSGGGTKGSYELGVWKALLELDIDYQIVTGTSIGSINGALMTTGDYERAKELWSTITMEDMMEDGINLTTTIEGMYEQREALRPFLKKYVKNKGADISPYTQFIEKLIDERAIRESRVDFGLVTVQFPSLKPCELTKKEIPEGLMKDYILASSAIFPLFPMHKIGEQMYLDGCYHDNLPIDLALRMGATTIIAVDLHTTPEHATYAKRPYVTYIKPSRPLGTMMNFDHALLMENADMGYQDTMKMYGRYLGWQYTFTRESVMKCRREINAFLAFLAKTDLCLKEDIPTKKPVKGDFNRLFLVLHEKSEGRSMTKEQYFVRAGELCGALFGMDVRPTYVMDDYMAELAERVGERGQYGDADVLVEKEGVELVARLTELKIKYPGSYVTGCVYYAIKEKKQNLDRLLLPLIAVLPEELAAAAFLLAL